MKYQSIYLSIYGVLRRKNNMLNGSVTVRVDWSSDHLSRWVYSKLTLPTPPSAQSRQHQRNVQRMEMCRRSIQVPYIHSQHEHTAECRPTASCRVYWSRRHTDVWWSCKVRSAGRLQSTDKSAEWFVSASVKISVVNLLYVPCDTRSLCLFWQRTSSK